MNRPKSMCAVVIPIYRDPFLHEFEWISLKRCIDILGGYDIILVHPEGLTLGVETRQRVKYLFSFERIFFTSISGYNRLMLSRSFYKRFKSYEYILIYQLDAYVFRDELRFWCQQGYDYIGGIWFSEESSRSEPTLNLWKPGNGGVSLRKIDAFLRVLRSWPLYHSPRQIYWLLVYTIRNKYFWNWIGAALLVPLKLVGFRNNLRWLAMRIDLNEDRFFAIIVPSVQTFSMPSAEKGVLFSWDRKPADLYNAYKRLPFCCHAWCRNDGVYEGNYDFWRKFVI